MSKVSCSFCTHANPSEAKFCNECGSPLGLKPCPSCEAVNEMAAERCHQCGAAFEALSEAPPVEAHASAMEQSWAQGAGGVFASASPLVDAASPVGGVEALAADESIAAAPFADAAQDAPIHIPESLADRLERDVGAHADGRIEPRIARSEGHHAHEAETASPVAWNTHMSPRSRAWRAPVVLAVLVAIAGAGYYAYKHHAPGIDRLAEFALAGRHADEPATAERKSRDTPPAATGANEAQPADVASKPSAPPSAPNRTTPTTAESDAQPASEANPAAAALVSPNGRRGGEQASERVSAEGSPMSVQPGARGHPTTDAVNAAQPGAKARPRPPSAASRNDDDAARQRTEAASRSRRQADADAIATQRLIARDLGTATGPPASTPAAPLDRDAAATQRLIERDLGPFLRPSDRSSKGGTYPAIN